MQIGIIDAELLTKSNHRFPNLASMKIAASELDKDNDVSLVLDWSDVDNYDKIYISKVFTATPIPSEVAKRIDNGDARIVTGGTGFYFDKAPPLPDSVEHIRPYYDLYKPFIDLQDNPKDAKLRYYRDYSIGFLTRHCFRGCPFCVNHNYKRVVDNAPLSEFYDATRKKICLCDDNILGYSGWRSKLDELLATNKRFVFRQGLDERLLTEEKVKILLSAPYDGDFIFAFDSIRDYDLIESKLKLLNKYRTDKSKIKFYVLTGFESTDLTDIETTFKRIELLFNYGAVPYIMKYRSPSGESYRLSKYAGVYTLLGRWCNNARYARKLSLREYVDLDNRYTKKPNISARSIELLVKDAPHLERYLDIRLKG